MQARGSLVGMTDFDIAYKIGRIEKRSADDMCLSGDIQGRVR